MTEPLANLLHSTAKLAEDKRTPPIRSVALADDLPFLPSSEQTIHCPKLVFHISL